MNLAMSNYAWHLDETEQVFDLLREYDVRGVELAPTRLFDHPYEQPVEVIEAWRQRVEDHGLKVVAIQGLLQGRSDLQLFGSTESRQALLAYLKRSVIFAHRLGAGVLVFGSWKNRRKGDLPPETVKELATEFFKQAGDYAQAYQLKICLEAVPSEYGADFITSTTEALEWVCRMNHPAIRLNLDLGALTFSRESYSLATRFAPWIGHVHLSEPWMQPLPQASTPHTLIAATLQEMDYLGWISLEMMAAAGQDNTVYIRRALSRLRPYYSKEKA